MNPTKHGSTPEPRRSADAPPPTPDDPVVELEALRAVLLDAAGRAGRLALSLKQQRRQTKALKAALRGLGQGW